MISLWVSGRGSRKSATGITGRGGSCNRPVPTIRSRQSRDRRRAAGARPARAGAAPELAGDEWREREFAESPDLFREELVVEGIRIDPVPGLPHLHEPDRLRFEDLKIECEVRIEIIGPAVSPAFSKCFRLRDCRFRFSSAGRTGPHSPVFFAHGNMPYTV